MSECVGCRIFEKYTAILEQKIKDLEFMQKVPMVWLFHGYTEKELEQMIKFYEENHGKEK